MKTFLSCCCCLFLFLSNGFAQKKKFSREVTIEDSTTLSLIDQYIEKVPEKKIIHLSVSTTKDSIFYRFEAIATTEIITEYIKSFFVFQYKGCYLLLDNGLGRMFQGNDTFPRYLTKKLKKYLVQGETIKNAGGGVKDVTFIIYEAPVMFATYSRGGVKVKWNGL